MTDRSFIRHVVFFSAKNKADLPQIMEGLTALGDIPHCSYFEVRENARVDGIANDIDVVVYAEFEDKKALAAYKDHPIYENAIKVVRPLRELRFAADF